jgi:hypothetical protein
MVNLLLSLLTSTLVPTAAEQIALLGRDIITSPTNLSTHYVGHFFDKDPLRVKLKDKIIELYNEKGRHTYQKGNAIYFATPEDRDDFLELLKHCRANI